MKYFFMTAGFLPQRDYVWWKFFSHEKTLKNAERSDLPQFKPFSDLNDWLDGDPGSSSLILGRDEHVFLLITDLPTTRQDYQRRIIRNSVVFVSENKNDEKTIRYLASAAIDSIKPISDALDKALQENTESRVSNWINFDEKFWEREFLNKLKIFDQKIPFYAYEDKNFFWQTLDFSIVKYSEEKKQEIRAYLLSDIDFPQKSKIFILITKNKDPKFYFDNSNQLGLVLTALEKSDQWKNKNKSEFFGNVSYKIENLTGFAIKQAKKISEKFSFDVVAAVFLLIFFGYHIFKRNLDLFTR